MGHDLKYKMYSHDISELIKTMITHIKSECYIVNHIIGEA